MAVLLCLANLPGPAAASGADGSAREAWLMTYGPAERVEELFGHNAIWIHDPNAGIDAIYNFGFFDFEQQSFFRNFAFGRMVYFAAAQSPAAELGYYMARDRSILAQRLDLEPAQFDHLVELLEQAVAPAHRDFRYDYFFNNCSTRVRDVLDEVLDGALRESGEARPAGLNFRGHVRRLTESRLWLYLGIHVGLGPLADRSRTAWEEMFLPEAVSEVMRRIARVDAQGNLVPVVASEQWLYTSSRPPAPEKPRFRAIGFGLAGALAAVLLVLPVVLSGATTWALLPYRLWLLCGFVAGVILWFLWLFTEHQAAWGNENLLIFNPLMIALLRPHPSRLQRWTAGLLLAGVLLAPVLKLLATSQWNHDLLLWLVPVQAAALLTWQRVAGRSGRSGRT